MTTEKRTKKSKGDANALDMLKADHAALTDWFEKVERALEAGDYDHARADAESLCLALTRHTEIEEALFYPLLRGAGDLDDMLDEARIDHRTMRELVLELLAVDVPDPVYAARLQKLKRCVTQHEKEEEEKLFPLMRKRGLDVRALGHRIVELDRALKADPECYAGRRRGTELATGD
jgi:hemerythrin superfamily protein